MEYPKEFVSAVLISATALMGLAGVFLAQLRLATKVPDMAPIELKVLRAFLSFAIVLGFVILMIAMAWFLEPSKDGLLKVMFALFTAQAISFLYAGLRVGLFFR